MAHLNSFLAIVLGTATLIFGACGTSDSDAQIDQKGYSTTQTDTGLIAKEVNSLHNLGDGKADISIDEINLSGKEVIASQDLQAFTPAHLAGFTRIRRKESIQIIEESILSNVQAEYKEGARSFTINLIDAGSAGPDFKSALGITKPSRVEHESGYTAMHNTEGYITHEHEEYSNDVVYSMLNILQHDRYSLKLEGVDVTVVELKEIVDEMQFRRLPAVAVVAEE